MDKIDKIHIGRVPYSIEAKAEAELNKYLAAIRNHLDEDMADEVVQDIESRIPELLAQRHIKQGDVVTHKDILALKEQLGEPEQFSSDEHSGAEVNTKKLFRDPDNAILCGVASGIGQYFNIDANFIRAAFFVATFLYGFGIFLYIFLCVLLPEAKTNADKLQMSGKAVTVANLQRYRGSAQKSLGYGTNMIRRILTKICRFVSVIGTAIASLILLSAFGAFSGLFYVDPFSSIATSYSPDYLLLGLMWLSCLSFIGLLIICTIRIWGHRSTRLNISAIAFSVLLILSIAGTATSGMFVYNHFSNKYGDNKSIRELSLVNKTPKITPTSLTVGSDSNLDLTYVVTNQSIHATFEDYPGLYHPNIQITDDNGILHVDSTNLADAAPSCLGGLCKHIYLPVHVFLYGPSLKTYNNTEGATLNINNASLGSSVAFTATNWSVTNINNSYATNMSITVSNYASLIANNTTAENTNVNIDQTSNVAIPISTNLTANVPLGCLEPAPPLPPNSIVTLPGLPTRAIVNGHRMSVNEIDSNVCFNQD
ncbi:MAG TPA: PspC domain-containing protein [Candidatus Saccharimonadales bacterium]|nr:PspC domain-containing protein [Candidatus Saccharimonadales bacterium]